MKSTVILLLTYFAPDGTLYKDFVQPHETMQACEAELPTWEKRFQSQVDKGIKFVLTCIPLRNAGDIKL